MTEKVGSLIYEMNVLKRLLQVEKSAFVSDKAVREMMKEMEDMYALAFGAHV